MGQRQRTTPRTPMERRALEMAETALEASGLRYQSRQIDGLALLFRLFAEHEFKLKASGSTPQEEPR